MKPSFPAPTWVWLALVAVASFLTWGTLSPTSFSGFPGGFPGGLFEGISITVNAWSGHLTLLGIQLPNWLTVVAATGAAGVAYARWTGTQLSSLLPMGLLLYGLVHVALFVLIVLVSGRGTLGIGSILMLVALAGLWRAIANASRPSASINAID